MSKQYIEILYPASSSRKSERIEIDENQGIKIPEDCYGFRFIRTLPSGMEEYDPTTYYIGEKVMTCEDVEREMPQEKSLIKTMRENKWEKVVRTRCGDFHHFRVNESLLVTMAGF